ncbi:MAG: YraN family protein [Candidatus Falkowbacteria bacterium]|nr:YraN family protein [Candidatus Falkowbacteria bacterium]
MKNQQLGKRGELAAKNWLCSQGHKITGQNVRLGHQEIDLIAQKDKLIIFFEVKTGLHSLTDAPLKKSQLKSLNKARIKFCHINSIPLEKTRLDLILIKPDKNLATLEHLINIGR